jgi:hypothetical protein
MDSLEKRREEIQAKKAKLEELKRQRMQRREAIQARESMGGSPNVGSPPLPVLKLILTMLSSLCNRPQIASSRNKSLINSSTI